MIPGINAYSPMKKNTICLLKIITLLVTVLLAVGCHHSRNRLSEDGKRWKLIVKEFNGSSNPKDGIIDFDEDGDFTIISEDKVSRGKFQTKGSDSMLLKMNDEEGIFKATYRFVENKLKLEGLVDSQDTLYWEMVEIPTK